MTIQIVGYDWQSFLKSAVTRAVDSDDLINKLAELAAILPTGASSYDVSWNMTTASTSTSNTDTIWIDMHSDDDGDSVSIM
jgi:hypothetical protein